MRTFFLALALILGFITYKYTDVITNSFGPIDTVLNNKMQNSTLSICYVVDKEKWLEFPLPKVVNNIRILSTANVLKSEVLNDDRIKTLNEPIYENFSLRIQVLDSDDAVLIDKVYSGRSSITVYQTEENGKIDISGITYYVDQPYIPTNSVNTLINLKPYKNYEKIRIKLESNDPSIKEVVTRVYVNKRVPKYKLEYMWERLSRKEKIGLTKGSVYPPELLNKNERYNILTNRWHAIGPYGIPGYSYERRKLYSYNYPPGNFLKPTLLPKGVVVDDEHVALIPIPEQGGKIQFNFNFLEKNVNESTVKILWHGRGLKNRQEEEIKITKEKPQYTQNYLGGYIEITSKNSFTLRLYQLEGKKKTEITPKPMYLRTFPLNETSPLEYDIKEVINDGLTPIRIDFRSLMKDGVKSKLIEFQYELIDGNEKVVEKGILSETLNVSEYDWYELNDQLYRISDYVSKYLYFPNTVKKVRLLKGSEEIFIAAYNRPGDFVQEIRVPEDAYAFDTIGMREERWYYVKPILSDRYVKENNYRQILIQYRPPEEEPQILAGIFNWEQFFPVGQFYSQDLALPIVIRPIFRENALPIFYRKIQANKNVDLDFEDFKTLTYVSPNLLWIKNKDIQNKKVTATIDSKFLFDETFLGKTGSFRLSPIKPGKHALNINTEKDMDLYINYTGYEQDGLMVRTAHKIQHSSLNFLYQRNSPDKEEMIIYFFPPFSNTERSKIRVTIIPPKNRLFGISNDWTPTAYIFDVNNADQAKAYVIGSAETVGNGQPLFMPLATDMPIGNYRVIVEHLSGPGGYVSLTRVIPGHSDVRKFVTGIGE